MNLKELYKQTAVERHKDIQVSRDRVFIKGTDGNIDEYLISGVEQELWLVHSDREQKEGIRAIKNKLSIR